MFTTRPIARLDFAAECLMPDAGRSAARTGLSPQRAASALRDRQPGGPLAVTIFICASTQTLLSQRHGRQPRSSLTV